MEVTGTVACRRGVVKLRLQRCGPEIEDQAEMATWAANAGCRILVEPAVAVLLVQGKVRLGGDLQSAKGSWICAFSVDQASSVACRCVVGCHSLTAVGLLSLKSHHV